MFRVNLSGTEYNCRMLVLKFFISVLPIFIMWVMWPRHMNVFANNGFTRWLGLGRNVIITKLCYGKALLWETPIFLPYVVYSQNSNIFMKFCVVDLVGQISACHK